MKLLSLNLIFCLFIFSLSNLKAQTISPNLVGTNVWLPNPSTTVWNYTRDCGIKMIRIGGHSYDDTMRSYSELKSWVTNIQNMGAEPIMQVSQYASAASAAALVKYFNVDLATGKPIKYWNIGNEPWLQNYSLASGVDVSGMVATYYKPRAEAMKIVDPTIKIIGPDFCYYVGFAINDLFGSGSANDIAVKIPGKDYYYCDGISWHMYPQSVTDGQRLAWEGVDNFNGSIVSCKARVDFANNKYGRTGDEALVWGIGEYNAKGGEQVHTYGNGQMFGAVLGLCMKYDALYATTWSMLEGSVPRTGSDFSMIDPTTMKPRSSYWHMQFVAKYFHGQYLAGKANNTGFLVHGAQDGDSTVVMIIHRATTGAPKEYTLDLNNVLQTSATYRLAVASSIDKQYTDIIDPECTQVLVFYGDTVTKITYDSSDFAKLTPPRSTTFILSDQLPGDPSAFSANTVSYSKINLTWTDNTDFEQGYIIERKTGEGTFATLGTVSANTTSYSDEGLTAETAYVYRVVAYNSNGKSGYSNESSATTDAVPAPVAFNGPHAIPGKIQAEDFNAGGEGLGYHDFDTANKGLKYRTIEGVDIESSTDTGLGYNLGYFEEGEWLTYLIENVTPGTYDIALRLASGSTLTLTRRLDVYIDNVKVGSVTPTITGGWQTWGNKYIQNVIINDDQPKLVKLVVTGGSFNLNWFEFGKDLSTAIGTRLDTRMNSYYNGNDQKIHVELSEALKDANVQVYNSLVQSIYSAKFAEATSIQIDAANLKSGIYMISVTNKTNRYTNKLMIR